MRPALELRQGGEDAKYEAACGGGGVDLRALAGEHTQAHAASGQFLNGVDEMSEVVTEEIKLPHDKCVALPSYQALNEGRSLNSGDTRMNHPLG